MNYTEQQKRKQEILQRIRAQQQIEQQRAKQKEFGLDDIQNLNNYRTGINTASKNTAKLGKALSNSGNKVVSGIGNKLQTVGKMGQNLTGEAAKQSISNAIKSKLGLGATKAAATGATTGATTGAAAGTAGTTAATTAGTLGAGTTAATTGATTAGALGAGTTAAGTAGALGAGATAAGTAAGTAATTGATTAALGAGATGATAAGTGAAAAGAGAAGAAGAGAGAAALGALGPVGAALAAGYMIYNMVQSAKKKKAAKQMQVSAQAAEEGAQQAAAKKASAMQNLQAQTPQAPQVQPTVEAPEMQLPQVEQVAEQPQEDSSAMDIMQMIPGLSEENVDVPNVEAMPTSLPEAPEVEAPQLEAPQIEPTALEGTPTGFATDISPETTKASLMERIKAGVGNIGNAAQGGLDKLSSGVNDFVAGYKDNAQTSLTEGDLYKRLMPTQDEQTGETQTEDGAYVLSADEKKKNLMNRIGEAFGTGRRIIAHPLTQGTIAGLAYAKSEDDPLYGLGKGVEWAQNKAKSDYYQRKIDPKSTPSIMGGYTEKDYNADTLSKYRETTAENNKIKAELAREKQRFDEMYKNEQIARGKEYNNARIEDMKDRRNLEHEKWDYKKEQDAKAEEEKRRKAEEEALEKGTLIRVISPDGRIGTIPAKEWKNAEKMGAKRI